MTINSVGHLSDRELLDATARSAHDERNAVVELLILLGEIDARRLFLPEGCSSLFTYCTQVLRFSEHEAYHRIEAARAARAFPSTLERLRDGALTLTSITILRPHLTQDNADDLIAGAQHRSKREVEQQMAALAPQPDAKSLVRRLPDAKPVTDSAQPMLEPAANHDMRREIDREGPTPPTPPPSAPRALSTPLSSDRYLLRVTLSAEAYAKLQRARDLMRHSVPNGDPAAIVEKALDLLVDDLERRRLARVKKSRLTNGGSESTNPASRYIPAAVRREVWARDHRRCAFVGRQGRCRETGFLELHHIDAFSLGGEATVENLELRCRAHNQYEGRLLFGPALAVDAGEARTRPGPS